MKKEKIKKEAELCKEKENGCGVAMRKKNNIQTCVPTYEYMFERI